MAIIAAGGSPLGLGSDFGGSIRGPSHLCGIAGLNPTMGRVPRTGHIPPYGGVYDTARIGLMARFVEDLALALPIITGPDGQDPSVVPAPLLDRAAVRLADVRVAFHVDNGVFPASAGTAAVVRSAAQSLADQGMRVEEACPAGLREIMAVATALGQAQGAIDQRAIFDHRNTEPSFDPADLAWYIDRRRKQVQLETLDQPGAAADLLHWTMQWDVCRRTMLQFLEHYDVILCPVDPSPAQLHGATMRGDVLPESVTGYTKPYSMAGWPAVVVRAGESSEGLPIGVQIVAGPWREDVALALALHIENTLGGWHQPSRGLSDPVPAQGF